MNGNTLAWSKPVAQLPFLLFFWHEGFVGISLWQNSSINLSHLPLRMPNAVRKSVPYIERKIFI